MNASVHQPIMGISRSVEMPSVEVGNSGIRTLLLQFNFSAGAPSAAQQAPRHVETGDADMFGPRYLQIWLSLIGLHCYPSSFCVISFYASVFLVFCIFHSFCMIFVNFEV
jgi:hypothetical protein